MFLQIMANAWCASKMELNRIYNEDCLETMKRLGPDAVDLVMTSPPYDAGIRAFKEDDAAGAWNWEKFQSVAKALFRTMKEGGVIVWITSDQTIKGDETGTSLKQILYFKEIGFKLYDTMIYAKNGVTMNSDAKHYWDGFEFMPVFTKGKIKTVNLLRDKKNKPCYRPNHWRRNRDGSFTKPTEMRVGEYGRRTNVWTYSTSYNITSRDKCAYEHPAIFPEPLARDNILSWSNKGDLVYDPFMGSGTTAKVAKQEGRLWLGSEVSKDYCEIADKRLHGILL